MATLSNPIEDRFFSDPKALEVLSKLNQESRTRVLRFAKYLLATEMQGIESLTGFAYDALPDAKKTALDLWASSVVDTNLTQ